MSLKDARNTCNRALGLLKDDIEVLVRLVAYLDPSLEKLLDVLRDGGIPGVRIDALREAG